MPIYYSNATLRTVIKKADFPRDKYWRHTLGAVLRRCRHVSFRDQRTRPTPMNDIQTKFMFRLSLEVGSHHVVGTTPVASRRIAPVTGGTFEGPELSGIVLPGGTDWISVDPNGTWFRIDVRLPLQTSDG